MSVSRHVMASLWIVAIAVTCHILFSSFGFNPTDDGFTLAYARRILDGEVPHRDFITIRPALSPLLHVPVVAFGGDATFMLSRFFVWLQFACIAWFGTRAITRKEAGVSMGEQAGLALIGFAIGCHAYPVMAWHTIDGLFLAVIGWNVLGTDSMRYRFVGYLLMSMAYLCKQSFLLVPFLAILIHRDVKSWKVWLAVLMPGISYVVLMAATGSLDDVALQLGSQTGLLQAGWLAYLNKMVAVGAGVVALAWITLRFAPSSGILFLLLLAGYAFREMLGLHLSWSAYAFFGAAFAATLLACLGKSWKHAQVGLMVLLIAWSVSISIGYNTPALAGGLLVIVIAMALHAKPVSTSAWRLAVVWSVAIVFAAGFWQARQQYTYRDLRTSELSESLEEILPGGKELRTNPNTAAFLRELPEVVEEATRSGQRYAIVPECAAWWVKSKQPNPLPIDWILRTELNDERLVQRVIDSVMDQRGGVVFIVQKVRATSIARRKDELPADYSPVLEAIRVHFRKTSETEYFEIYR